MQVDGTRSDREVESQNAATGVEIECRDATRDDFPFIYATFLRSLYYDNDWFGLIHKDVFMEKYHNIIESLLFHRSTTLRIVCLKEEKSVILGYALFTLPHHLHYMFVKRAWRRAGVARLLLKHVDVKVITHVTNQAIHILKQQQSAWEFNPFALQPTEESS